MTEGRGGAEVDQAEKKGKERLEERKEGRTEEEISVAESDCKCRWL